MPELPEVEIIARTLRPQVLNQTITGVELLLEKTAQAGKGLLLEAVPGMSIARVFRRAKLVMIELRREKPVAGLPSSLFLGFHLKMTGKFFVHPKGSAPLKHTRIIFDLSGGGRLFFDDMRTFGYCRAMLPEELPSWQFWDALGPEPLETPPDELAKRFGQYRAGIKAVLLDQSAVAGVGNIYADESLFEARINPRARAADIPPQKLKKLAQALQAILRLSIEECGSSIRDYTDSLGNAGAFQNSFKVYGRKGEACASCSRALETQKVAGRTTTFCSNCQK